MSPARRSRPKPKKTPSAAKAPRPVARRVASRGSKAGVLDSPDGMAKLDPLGMGDLIERFPDQFRAGSSIAGQMIERVDFEHPHRVVLFGMGGSAIAGDLIRCLVDREGTTAIRVVRHYDPPGWLSPEDFLIFSSYSGETEETIAAYKRLRKRGGRACVITTGGRLLDYARSDEVPVALLPPGLPPRAALGYSFATIAHIVEHLGLLAGAGSRVEAVARALEQVASALGRTVIQSRNPAKKLAIRLMDRAVVVLADQRTLGPAAVRWKCQLNENAKHLAWTSLLPEMNHNELDSFAFPAGAAKRLVAVMLRDPWEHPRVQARFRWLSGFLKRREIPVETVETKGDDAMTRLMSCVAMGDFVSYYLALLHGTDPSALPGVTSLKRALSG
jgi:glucose/mannose-6-phosphate isomerase